MGLYTRDVSNRLETELPRPILLAPLDIRRLKHENFNVNKFGLNFHQLQILGYVCLSIGFTLFATDS